MRPTLHHRTEPQWWELDGLGVVRRYGRTHEQHRVLERRESAELAADAARRGDAGLDWHAIGQAVADRHHPLDHLWASPTPLRLLSPARRHPAPTPDRPVFIDDPYDPHRPRVPTEGVLAWYREQVAAGRLRLDPEHSLRTAARRS